MNSWSTCGFWQVNAPKQEIIESSQSTTQKDETEDPAEDMQFDMVRQNWVGCHNNTISEIIWGSKIDKLRGALFDYYCK